jgi:hypothetical protein
MIHKHKWIYNQRIEEERKLPIDRYCEKCSETQYLYHLSHNGIEWYGYQKENPLFSEEEIKQKEKRTGVLGLFVIIIIGIFMFFFQPYMKSNLFLEILVISFVLFFLYLWAKTSWKQMMMWSKKVL